MGTRPWNPQDLPADFKLTWHHFPDRSTVTLDANGKITQIENKFNNGSNPATTANVNMRQSLTKMNGYDTATGTKGQGGILISDISKFPQGNADRFMMFVVGADGLNGDAGTVGGYMHQNGGSNWWIDGDFLLRGSSGSVNGGSLTRKVLHTLCANHKSGTTTLRADGVQKASGAVTLTGANPYNQTIGIKGPKEDYYTIGGSTLAAIYGNRAATADEMWLIEAFYAPFAGQAIASDNPYKTGLPMIDDGGAAAPMATCRILWF